MIGRSFSHYKIIEEISGSEVGRVYKAEDTQRDRPVALKILPKSLTSDETVKRRFVRDVRAVSDLDHPNIYNVLEVGETEEGQVFVCSDWLDGENIRERLVAGPMFVQESVEIAHEIAEGLSYAHDNDVVHGDVKPANVFITRTGLAKVLDFGMATLTGPSRAANDGSNLGTSAYLSPEQAMGGHVDHRTDIWSVGVVMYEMLTGVQPFRGRDDGAIVHSILNDEPRPVTELRPEIPHHLGDIIHQCLQKNPVDRFASSGEFLQQLKILAGGLRMDRALFTHPLSETPATGAASTLGRVFWPAVSVLTVLLIAAAVLIWRGIDPSSLQSGGETKVRVAVLPLENRAGAEPGDAFVDGLSETVASTAAGLEPYHKSMWVTAYTTQMPGAPRDPKDAHDAFGVNRLLCGNVAQHQDGYRLTLDVLDAASLEPIETRHVDFDEDSANSLQPGVVDAIVDLLDARVAPQQRADLATKSDSPPAYKSYLEGLGLLRQAQSGDDVNLAIASLQTSVEVDPSFAPAHAWLAEAFKRKSQFTGEDTWLERAESSCQHALELNRSLLKARVTLAELYRKTDRQPMAADLYRDVLESNPKNDVAGRSIADLFFTQNRLDEAESAYRDVIEAEPDNYMGHVQLGTFYHATGRVEDAATEYERTLELAPNDVWTLNRLGTLRYEQQRWPEARELLERSFELQPTGDTAYCIGCTLEQTGYRESALRRIGEAVQYGYPLEKIEADPLLEALREDPRFHTMLENETNAGGSPETR